MRLVLSVLLLLSFNALAEPRIFLSLALEYKYDEVEYAHIDPNSGEITNSLDMPKDNLGVEVGVMWPSGLMIGVRHDSTMSGGCPFNCSEPEYYRNGLFIKKQFGGY